jgi:hypothetical protein
MFTCEIVERVAQIRLLAGGPGVPVPIPDEFVRSERERWLHKNGKAEDGAVVRAAKESKG